MRTRELEAILAALFPSLVPRPEALIDPLLRCIAEARTRQQGDRAANRLQTRLDQLRAKKDALLELYGAGAVSAREFRQRNEGFNRQIAELEGQLARRAAEQGGTGPDCADPGQLREALAEELALRGPERARLAALVLDRAVVLEGSDDREIDLMLYLRPGPTVPVHISRSPFAFRFPSSSLCAPPGAGCAR